jgi:hypothetical protein
MYQLLSTTTWQILNFWLYFVEHYSTFCPHKSYLSSNIDLENLLLKECIIIQNMTLDYMDVNDGIIIPQQT